MGVTIVESEEDCRIAIDNFKKHYEAFPVLGFGFELDYTGVNYALLQLAAIDGECILIRLQKLKQIPENLLCILENEFILKVGVQTLRDANELRHTYSYSKYFGDNIKVRGTLDLRFLATKHDASNPGKLDVLARKYVAVVIEEDWDAVKKPRNEDYETRKTLLRNVQVDYATRKTQVAASIFKKLASLLWPMTNDWAMIYKHCTKLDCFDKTYEYQRYK